MHGSYNAIDGGDIGYAFSLLTGAPYENLKHSKTKDLVE
jgi:hypothetical protein